MSAKVIGLVAHPRKRGVAALVTSLREEFKRLGAKLLLEHDAAALVGETEAYSVTDLGGRCEMIVVLGGDGTILRAVHDLGANLRPIFGINLGTLGFLTCLGPADFRQAAQCVVQGHYDLSQRLLLSVELIRDQSVVDRHIGLNDAVISRGALSRLIRLETRINGALLTEYNADGLIVATPTGSTAYSLSAGGPLLTPDAHVFAITPICPHTLTNRSVIIDDNARVEVRLRDREDEVYPTVDGQRAIAMRPADILRIVKSERTLPLAVLPDLPFFELARRKLNWSGGSI